MHRTVDMKGGEFYQAFVQLLVLVVGVIGLKDVKIRVPHMVRSGDSALLTCSYELENNIPLETIKWYLGEEEFYHYSPTDNPPWVSYNVRNISVDHTRSNMQDVTLVNVMPSISGIYRCEVSEGPDKYETKILEAVMIVVDVPESEPIVEAEKKRLPTGETLRVNCTSGASRPAPNITWTLNGLQLDSKNMKYKVKSRNAAAGGGKNRTHSNLELKVTSNLFQGGQLHIRCFASIVHVYHASASVDVTEDTPFLASITGDASPRNDLKNIGHKSGVFSLMYITFVTCVVMLLNHVSTILIWR